MTELQLYISGGHTWFDVLAHGTKVGCFMEERWECENSTDRTYVEWTYEGDWDYYQAAVGLLSAQEVYLRSIKKGLCRSGVLPQWYGEYYYAETAPDENLEELISTLGLPKRQHNTTGE